MVANPYFGRLRLVLHGLVPEVPSEQAEERRRRRVGSNSNERPADLTEPSTHFTIPHESPKTNPTQPLTRIHLRVAFAGTTVYLQTTISHPPRLLGFLCRRHEEPLTRTSPSHRGIHPSTPPSLVTQTRSEDSTRICSFFADRRKE